MNQNIASLAEALEKLGFDASLRTPIVTHIALQVLHFRLSSQISKERDVLKFNLFFERKDNAYSCLCYDAFLRKEIILPDISVDSIQLRELDKQMCAIDWNNIFNKEQNIASIINDLQILSSSKEGKEYAEQLKIKYWSDTPLETIMNISFLKPKYEISQRFYLLENGNGISIEEAYRFLNNKWMERQVRKKPATGVIETKTNIKSKVAKSAKKRNERKE